MHKADLRCCCRSAAARRSAAACPAVLAAASPAVLADALLACTERQQLSVVNECIHTMSLAMRRVEHEMSMKLVAWGMKTCPFGMKYKLVVRNACAWYEMKAQHETKPVSQGMKLLYKGMKKVKKKLGSEKVQFGYEKKQFLKISHFIP